MPVANEPYMEEMPRPESPVGVFSLEEHPIEDLFAEGLRGRAVSMVVVGGNTMIMALPQCRVLRWRVHLDAQPEEIEVCRYGATFTGPSGASETDDIARIFLDAHGIHLVVSMRGGDYYYLHSRASSGGSGGGGCEAAAHSAEAERRR